ncbi:MAG: hypothetical protein Q8O75_04055 [bacterium]|nr:hypothetical protein [bacterium]
MNKNLVSILLLTFITLAAWVVFQILKIATASTIPAPTQEQIQSLDPTLDKNLLQELDKELK